MGVWVPIKGRWWIAAIPLVVFTVVGIGLIVVSRSISAYDPDRLISRQDELLLMGILFVTFPAISTGLLYRRMNKGVKRAQTLVESGIEGSAEILSVEETGVTVNNAPKILMELEVSLPGSESYRLTHSECISLLHIHRIKPGIRHRVFVNPDDRESIFLVYDAHSV